MRDITIPTGNRDSPRKRQFDTACERIEWVKFHPDKNLVGSLWLELCLYECGAGTGWSKSVDSFYFSDCESTFPISVPNAL